MNEADSPAALEAAIARYNDAWNAHDLDAIMSMHAPDMVFENHTAHERAEGDAVRAHIGSIFETWPDIRFEGRRTYCPRRARGPGMDRNGDARERDAPRRPGRRANRQEGHLGRARRDPVRRRAGEAQGRLLGLGHDPRRLGADLT